MVTNLSATATSITFEVSCLGGTDQSGNHGSALANLDYYGTPDETPGCATLVDSVDNLEGCTTYFTYQLVPAGTGGGSSSAAEATALARLTPSAPTFAGSVPSPGANPALPYVYTDYPVQVSLGNVPGAVGPVTTTATDLFTDGGPAPVPLTVTATVSGTLAGFDWTTQGAQTDDVACGPGQDSLSPTNDDRTANPSICTIDWTQRSGPQGWPLTGEATYATTGTVSVSGPFGSLDLVDGPIGDVSTPPVTTAMPVAELESVGCDPDPAAGNC